MFFGLPPSCLQFSNAVEKNASLRGVLNGDSSMSFAGWNTFCSEVGYSSSVCDDAATRIASSADQNVRGAMI